MDRIHKTDFHFMEGSKSRCFTHLSSLSNPIDKLKYVSAKNPYASEWIDQDTGETFWRPKIGDIIVSTDGEFKRYATLKGAYKEAVRLKKLMIKKLEALKISYANRDCNRQIISSHRLQTT